MSVSARGLAAIGLAALVPVWLYALQISGGVTVALASTTCVLLVVGGLYVMFGPHDDEESVVGSV
ncbi:hypothetical protein [Halolamina salina]|uniref:DUF8131 domain-containing protein n=1 Tax=Halolamina salina TaxID=1220023 RepID=A0ABD6B873_9EURY